MWATSIGLTFAHSPVPGERKSGMPDGTEMPAPVSATTEPAERISSANALAEVSDSARPLSSGTAGESNRPSPASTPPPPPARHAVGWDEMTETLPDNIDPYPGISSKAYEHPADRAATAA